MNKPRVDKKGVVEAKKLTKEKLLEWLGKEIQSLKTRLESAINFGWWDKANIIQLDLIRYIQLEEIVGDYEYFQIFREEVIAKIKEQQKPRVSREDVYKYVNTQWKECEYQSKKYPHGPESYDVKGMIIDFLKKHGWKVEE